MKTIFHVAGWNGGHFEPKDHVKEGAQVFVNASDKTYVGNLKKGQKVKGTDDDMGHTYAWSFQDYDIEFQTDPFDRKTSLLRTLNDNRVSVWINDHENPLRNA